MKNFINSTIRRNIRRYNKIKPLNEKILVNSIKLLDCPEVKEILLCTKRLKSPELCSFCLSSNALEFINSIESEEEKVAQKKVEEKGEEKEEDEKKKEKEEKEERAKDLELVYELDKILEALSKKKKI